MANEGGDCHEHDLRRRMSRLGAMLIGLDVVIEGATGLALIAVPGVVAELLLGSDLPEIGAVTARVAGIALVALALGCWLGRRDRGGFSALAALLAYNAITAIYLGWLGLDDVFVGPLLWPAVVVHAVVAVLLGIAVWQSTVEQPAISSTSE